MKKGPSDTSWNRAQRSSIARPRMIRAQLRPYSSCRSTSGPARRAACSSATADASASRSRATVAAAAFVVFPAMACAPTSGSPFALRERQVPIPVVVDRAVGSPQPS